MPKRSTSARPISPHHIHCFYYINHRSPPHSAPTHFVIYVMLHTSSHALGSTKAKEILPRIRVCPAHSRNETVKISLSIYRQNRPPGTLTASSTPILDLGNIKKKKNGLLHCCGIWKETTNGCGRWTTVCSHDFCSCCFGCHKLFGIALQRI